MKTISEAKFERVIKEGFHELLKPLGFKKKANNFYLPLDGIGQIINIQKSSFGNKENISFTINTGIFVPQYWLAFYNYNNKGLPSYPTEPDCLLRNRIGRLKKQHDTWYDIEENTNEQDLIYEMRKNVIDFILPYFNKVSSIQVLIEEVDGSDYFSPIGKLAIYAELNYFDKAKQAYELLLKNTTAPGSLLTLKEYGQKYGFGK